MGRLMSLTCEPLEEVEEVEESLLVGFRSQEEDVEEEEERVVLARAESSWETFLLSPLLLLRMDSTGDLQSRDGVEGAAAAARPLLQ